MDLTRLLLTHFSMLKGLMMFLITNGLLSSSVTPLSPSHACPHVHQRAHSFKIGNIQYMEDSPPPHHTAKYKHTYTFQHTSNQLIITRESPPKAMRFIETFSTFSQRHPHVFSPRSRRRHLGAGDCLRRNDSLCVSCTEMALAGLPLYLPRARPSLQF